MWIEVFILFWVPRSFLVLREMDVWTCHIDCCWVRDESTGSWDRHELPVQVMIQRIVPRRVRRAAAQETWRLLGLIPSSSTVIRSQRHRWWRCLRSFLVNALDNHFWGDWTACIGERGCSFWKLR